MRSAEARCRERWPDRLIRTQPSEQRRLHLHNLYILPSRFGWLWLAACGVLWLMGSASGSSGPLLLAFSGLGLFLISPFLTQFNLQGLELRCGTPQPGFANGLVLYPLEARSDCARLRLRASFHQQRDHWCGDLAAGNRELAVPWTATQRGLQRPGRLRLESHAPLGLFVCWTLWEPSTPQLIYPTPLRGSVGRAEQAAGQPIHARGGGSHDWQDLTPHRPEEGLTRLAWKQLARSGTRLSKRFSDPEPQGELLKPDPSLPWEQALEQLCDQCLRLSASGTAFGLEVGATRITAAAGDRQLRLCLEALALAPRRAEP